MSYYENRNIKYQVLTAQSVLCLVFINISQFVRQDIAVISGFHCFQFLNCKIMANFAFNIGKLNSISNQFSFSLYIYLNLQRCVRFQFFRARV